MGKTSKKNRRSDNPYAVEGHHLVHQTAFPPGLAIGAGTGGSAGGGVVDSSPQGNLGASLSSSSPPPSSVGSVISIPDESPTTPQTFMNNNNSYYSSDTSLPIDGGGGGMVSSIQTASAAAVAAATINAATASTTSTTTANSLVGSPGVSGGGKSTFTAWFITEVMAMMHGLGDVKKPLPESAAIVEELVHQQMVSFVLQALEISQTRNASSTTSSSSSLEVEDCLFLLRNNKVKLKRLYRYFRVSDLKEKANSSSFDAAAATADDDLKGCGGGGGEAGKKEGKSSSSKPKITTILKRFIRSIDTPSHSLLSYLEEDDGDVEDDDDDDDGDVVDPVKLERLRRAEMQSRRMSVDEYMRFTEARSASFFSGVGGGGGGGGGKSGRGKNKLKEWLFAGSRHLHHLDVKVDSIALDILCYLAKETVAEIIDLGILIRREPLVMIEDPSTYLRGIPPAVVDKLENPGSSSSSAVTSASGNGGGSTAWDGVNIPGLGGVDECKPLDESRGALQPWHIREAVARYLDNGFAPFALRRKTLDHGRMGRVLFCR